VNTHEIAVFDSLDIDQRAVTPESYFGYSIVERINAQSHSFSWSGILYFDLHIVKGNSSIRINASFHSKAKDVFY